jgi:hypothetical protein
VVLLFIFSKMPGNFGDMGTGLADGFVMHRRDRSVKDDHYRGRRESEPWNDVSFAD